MAFSLRRITEVESQLLGKETLWTASKISGDWSWKRRLLMWREIQTARNCILDDVWSFTWWNDSRNWAEPQTWCQCRSTSKWGPGFSMGRVHFYLLTLQELISRIALVEERSSFVQQSLASLMDRFLYYQSPIWRFVIFWSKKSNVFQPWPSHD